MTSTYARSAAFALGTIVLFVTRLNTIVGEAIAEGIITADPFAGYEAEHPEREQTLRRRGVPTADDHTRDLILFQTHLFLLLQGIPLRGLQRLPDDLGSGSGRGR